MQEQHDKFPKTKDLFYTRQEVADLFGVSLTTVYIWARSKRLESIKHPLSGSVLFKKEVVDNLLNKVGRNVKEKTKKEN